MKAASARQKGAKLERWVAEKLSVAFNRKCRRSGIGFKGSDIVNLPKWLSVECKNRENWTWSYVDQTMKDAGDKMGIMFWKRNNKQPLAILDADDLIKLLAIANPHLERP